MNRITVTQFPPTKKTLDTLHVSLQKCIKEHFIPNSTYYSSDVSIINDKANNSFVYDELTDSIYVIDKMDKLVIKTRDGWDEEFTITKKINSSDWKSCEMARDIHKSISYMLVINGKSNQLMAIGNDQYIYYILSQKRYQNMIAISDNIDELINCQDNCNDYNIDCHLHNVSSYYDITQYPSVNDYNIKKVDVIISSSNLINGVLGYLKYLKSHIGIICIITSHNTEIGNVMKHDFKLISYQFMDSPKYKYKIELYEPIV